MNAASLLPPPKVLMRSVVAVLAIAAPIGMVWWLIGESTAMGAWLGVTAMLIAITRVQVQRQVVIGVLAGVAAGLGAWVDGHLLLLSIVVVVACLAQWQFNQWSVVSGALLPALAFYYWASAAEPSADGPVLVGLATWLGAAIAIAVGVLAKLDGAERPAGRADATWHAVGLALGCVVVIILIATFDLPRGFWGILTICLVYRPTYEETTARVWQRSVGTVIGAVVAVAIGIVVPQAAIVAVAVLGAVLTVAYALTHDYLRYSVLLTLTIVLLFGAGEPVLDLAAERAGMTILGAAIALLLTALTERVLRPGARSRRAAGPGSPAGPTG